jgi:beta-glucanase (GH16 family)
MKTYVSLLSVPAALMIWCATASAQGTGETGGYKLIWEDLFEAGAVNTKTWNIEENGNGGGNQELQYYRPANVTVEPDPATGKNCLVITARRGASGGKSFTSGRINTKGYKHFKHGKLEASIKFPKTANGLWPAFWLLGADFPSTPWPQSGEIDIVEMGNRAGIDAGVQSRHLVGAAHWGEVINGGHPNYGLEVTAPYSLQDDFHLYTLIWNNDRIETYLDLDKNPGAAPYYAMDIAVQPGQAADHPANYLHKKMFILLNLAVGGNFPQIWDAPGITALGGTNGEAKMYVDFVRLYQKGASSENEEYFNSAEPAPPSAAYSISPNPATGLVSITGPRTPRRADLYNYKGQHILTAEQPLDIDVSGLIKGHYILTIETDNGVKESFKLIKD